MWLMNRAIERANEFNIPAGPIDFRKTQGVVKRIIPAVASTNAVIGMFLWPNRELHVKPYFKLLNVRQKPLNWLHLLTRIWRIILYSIKLKEFTLIRFNVRKKMIA